MMSVAIDVVVVNFCSALDYFFFWKIVLLCIVVVYSVSFSWTSFSSSSHTYWKPETAMRWYWIIGYRCFSIRYPTQIPLRYKSGKHWTCLLPMDAERYWIQSFRIQTGQWMRPCLVTKSFQDSLLHQIFWHIYGALNIVLKNNQLHSLVVNDEMNLLSLISLRLDTNY